MKLVYLSSPYSIGDKEKNVQRQFDAAKILIDRGFNVWCPLVGHFMQPTLNLSWEEWLKIDLDWLSRCDVVLRLDGESKGADEEVLYAEENSIPVYYKIEELINNFKNYE